MVVCAFFGGIRFCLWFNESFFRCCLLLERSVVIGVRDGALGLVLLTYSSWSLFSLFEIIKMQHLFIKRFAFPASCQRQTIIYRLNINAAVAHHNRLNERRKKRVLDCKKKKSEKNDGIS